MVLMDIKRDIYEALEKIKLFNASYRIRKYSKAASNPNLNCKPT